ncbi:MAG: hypothetical protein QXV17_14880 [Candidatus Micrarchaeaceae archaeon]
MKKEDFKKMKKEGNYTNSNEVNKLFGNIYYHIVINRDHLSGYSYYGAIQKTLNFISFLPDNKIINVNIYKISGSKRTLIFTVKNNCLEIEAMLRDKINKESMRRLKKPNTTLDNF